MDKNIAVGDLVKFKWSDNEFFCVVNVSEKLICVSDIHYGEKRLHVSKSDINAIYKMISYELMKLSV